VITVGLVDPQRTRELRRSVLRPALDPEDALPGDELPDAAHFGATDPDGTVLCTCFVYPDPCPWLPERPGAWHLRQMATDPDHRKRGLGAAVVRAAAGYARALGAPVLWCHARETAAGFYARLGFVPHGAVFTDERHTIPHRSMWLELAEPSAPPTASHP
jgi:GNAT superfamily N-acetyltransferase